MLSDKYYDSDMFFPSLLEYGVANVLKEKFLAGRVEQKWLLEIIIGGTSNLLEKM